MVRSEGYIGVVKWNEGKVMLKCECNSLRQYVFNYYCLVFNININFSTY
jgi:hypothetical protein